MKSKTKILLLTLLSLIAILMACKELDLQRQMLIKTLEVSNITSEGATVKGEIIDFGEGMTDHGVYYSTTANAQNGSEVSLGKPTGTGKFTVTLTKLESETRYYTKAYGTDGNVFVYGDEFSFIPKVGTDGIKFSIHVQPIFNAKCIACHGSSGGLSLEAGKAFSSIVPERVNLTKPEESLIYNKVIPSNTHFANYTNEDAQIILSWIQQGALNDERDAIPEAVKDYDGNTYKTVIIGTQTWMAENLKVTHYPNGSPIPLHTDSWFDLDDAYCYYNNQSTSQYGALYTYQAAKEACPTGWHLPSDDEWAKLESYVSNDGFEGSVGAALKNNSGWNTNGNGTNNYDFSAIPGGYRQNSSVPFAQAGYSGLWWSATKFNGYNSYTRSLSYNSSLISRGNHYISTGLSVLCVQD